MLLLLIGLRNIKRPDIIKLMKISYDKEVDALNVSLGVGTVVKTVEISPEVFVDLDKKGNPLYLEIIGASEKIGKKNFEKVIIGGKSISLLSLV